MCVEDEETLVYCYTNKEFYTFNWLRGKKLFCVCVCIGVDNEMEQKKEREKKIGRMQSRKKEGKTNIYVDYD